MDLQTFMTGLGAFTLFPPHVIAYAGTVAPSMDDAGRQKLMTELQAIHLDLQRLERQQKAEYDKALAELKQIKRVEMPALRREAEKYEQKDAFDEAAKKLDA